MLNRYTDTLPRVFLSYVAIALVAVGLHVVSLGQFLTIDEATTWITHAHTFLDVLESGDYASMPFEGHPAITTMWLGSVGVFLHRLLSSASILNGEPYAVTLAIYRLPTALVNAAGILAGYAMLRRMVPSAVAFLATLLWATDPFVLAFNRLLHMDGLLATFVTLSLLSAGLYWNHRHHPAWLAVSGITMGLAILSKIPALVLVPLVGLVALFSQRQPVPPSPTEPKPEGAAGWASFLSFSFLAPRLAPFLVWLLLGGVTVFALWPAFWVNPLHGYQAIRFGVEVEGGRPHGLGNFFLGREVSSPGPLFYPVALALRMTPWAMVGLLFLPFALWGRGSGGKGRGMELRSVTALVGFVILFILAMSLFPLKFNRYIVPVFPAVNILAAIGLVGGWGWGHRTAHGEQDAASPPGNHPPLASAPTGIRGIITAVIALVALVNVAWYHPYPITYFNQLLGGAPAGARTFVVGWGEGFGQVGAWLNRQPDSTGVVTVARLPQLLNPYLKPEVHAARETRDGDLLPEQAGYLVVYLAHVQRPTEWLTPPYDRFFFEKSPAHVVTIHGVDYAWIYQVPQEMPHNLTVDFGEAIRLQGYDIGVSAVRTTGFLTVTTQWQARAPVPEDYQLFVHVLDEDGKLVGHADVPPAGPDAPTSTWQPHRYYRWKHPVPLPPDLPAGPYWVALGLYRPDDFTRLPLRGAVPPQPGAPDDGRDALVLEPLVLE